ncbi:unnamed protein product [Ostreobium quekettii]|uniref:Uncharacterized protein n=1 Tax=Ostreobium quekettii TaxID=121088 RepID=A0A8S1IUA0_9CHLO|nr:unnamed protein product [Ostreobium quekettii]
MLKGGCTEPLQRKQCGRITTHNSRIGPYRFRYSPRVHCRSCKDMRRKDNSATSTLQRQKSPPESVVDRSKSSFFLRRCDEISKDSQSLSSSITCTLILLLSLTGVGKQGATLPSAPSVCHSTHLH